MSSKDKFNKLSKVIIDNIGGEENVSNFSHCVTRLRFNIKDRGLVNDEVIKNQSSVIGVQWSGEQFQVIIGPDVEEVFENVKRTGNFGSNVSSDDLVEVNKDLSFKGVLNSLTTALADCFIPILPAIVASSFIGLIPTIFGPNMLNYLSAESNIFVLFTFIGNVGFYFLPVFMGMTAARRFGTSQILGLFIGLMILHPTFIEIVSAGEPFTVYGLPMTLVSYGGSTLPVILSVWVMSYVEKFIKKYCPRSLRMIIVPTLTILVMLPIVFVVIGPFGTLVGNGLANAVVEIASIGRLSHIIVGTLIGAFNIFAILTGMHIPLYIIALGVMAANNGADSLFLPASMASVASLLGVEIGAVLRARKAENRALSLSYLVTHAVGGVTEPAIFGLGIRYVKPLVCTCVGAAVGSLFMMITSATVYTIVPTSSLLVITSFLGSTTSNFTLGVVGLGIAALVGAVTTYFFGFTNEEF